MVKFDGHTLTYEEGVEHGERTAAGLTYWENACMFAKWKHTREATPFAQGMADGLLNYMKQRKDS